MLRDYWVRYCKVGLAVGTVGVWDSVSLRLPSLSLCVCPSVSLSLCIAFYPSIHPSTSVSLSLSLSLSLPLSLPHVRSFFLFSVAAWHSTHLTSLMGGKSSCTHASCLQALISPHPAYEPKIPQHHSRCLWIQSRISNLFLGNASSIRLSLSDICALGWEP